MYIRIYLILYTLPQAQSEAWVEWEGKIYFVPLSCEMYTSSERRMHFLAFYFCITKLIAAWRTGLYSIILHQWSDFPGHNEKHGSYSVAKKNDDFCGWKPSIKCTWLQQKQLYPFHFELFIEKRYQNGQPVRYYETEHMWTLDMYSG